MPIRPQRFDLEGRTLTFARDVRDFLKRLPTSDANSVDKRQLARSSGSVGANYREANDALGRRDFAMRIRIARKEAKESCYWLQLVDAGGNEQLQADRNRLVDEADQLVRILSRILIKVTESRPESGSG